MAYVIKNLKVTWQWEGDIYAINGFNVAITPVGVRPTDEIIVLAQTGKELFEHTFRQLTLKEGVEHTAWVQAIYPDKDSEWLDVSGFIASDDGTATITTKDQHDSLLNETVNYRTTGAPTNEPVPTNVAVIENQNGSVDIKIDWAAYVQGTAEGERTADFLVLFWKKGTATGLTIPTVADSNVQLSVNESQGAYYELEGLPPNTYYRFGIAAARKTENGIEIGNIVSPSSWTDIDVGDATINHDNVTATAGGGTFILDSNGIRHTSGSFSVDAAGNAHFQGELVIGTTPTSTDDLETQTGAQAKATTAETNAKTYADETFQTEIPKGTTAPSSPSDGDLWIDTTPDPNILKRYETSITSWVNLSPTTANDIGAEQSMTKGTTAPSSPASGDLWIDTSEIPNTLKVYDGSTWNDSRVKDTNDINDGAGLGNTANWTQVADDGGKPTDNADVTGDNTSANTNNVGNKSATDVESGVDNANTAKGAVDNWTSDNTNYTTISGGVVRTGKIESENYSSGVTGSQMDLDNGTLDLGGKLNYNPATGLVIEGAITVTGGNASTKAYTDTAEQNAKNYANQVSNTNERMRLKPEGAYLWHFDGNITSTDGTIAEVN